MFVVVDVVVVQSRDRRAKTTTPDHNSCETTARWRVIYLDYRVRLVLLFQFVAFAHRIFRNTFHQITQNVRPCIRGTGFELETRNEKELTDAFFRHVKVGARGISNLQEGRKQASKEGGREGRKEGRKEAMAGCSCFCGCCCSSSIATYSCRSLRFPALPWSPPLPGSIVRRHTFLRLLVKVELIP